MLGGLVVMTAATANAEVVKLQADLKGSNEVPPNNSPGTGKAEATYDTEAKTLTYTVSFAGLTGPAMGAHFHGPVEPGKNAGIVLPFKTIQSPIQGARRSRKLRLRICWPGNGTPTFILPRTRAVNFAGR